MQQKVIPKLDTYWILLAIAIIFHMVGLVGIGMLKSPALLATTPLHLSLMFALLLVSYWPQRSSYFIWWPVAYMAGYAVEWVGVHTGWLFGEYQYSDVLGWEVSGVPLLIGVNWVVVITGAISLAWLINGNKLLTTAMAATIATAFDWVIEPVCIRLNYWHWAGDTVPLWNYACWWLVSFGMAWLWLALKIVPNKFGLALFIIQLLFFIALRFLL